MPPAGNGTIRITGWLGHACAEETLGDSYSTAKTIIGKLGMIPRLAPTVIQTLIFKA